MFRLFKKGRQLKIGDRYRFNKDPFTDKYVDVIDIKKGFVQYKNQDGDISSRSINGFLDWYSIRVGE